MYTPWGPSQELERVSADITAVTTASHGGYRVSGQSWKRFRELFPDVKLFAGSGPMTGWFEEDCDWALVALAFPEFFRDKPGAIEAALKSAQEFLKLSERELAYINREFQTTG